MLVRLAPRFAPRLVATCLAACSGLVQALDPSLEASQYGHTVWNGGEDFVPDNIGSITQTSDGYLWFGTPSGVVRFDGLRGVKWRPPSGAALPDERTRVLLGTRDGSLWIGTARGLARWKDGTATNHEPLKGKIVNALAEDEDGTVWVAGAGRENGFLCALKAERHECHGDDGRFGRAVTSLYRDAAGTLWVAGTDQVWRWTPGPPVSYPLPGSIGALQTMTGMPDGAIVVAAGGRIVRIQEGKVQPLSVPHSERAWGFNKILCDRDGVLWMGATDFGLLHLHGDRLDVFRTSEGLSGDHILALFEDREGNVWVSTTHGLDRFRAPVAEVYSRAQGLSGRVATVLPARDGTAWASTSTGLYRLSGNRAEMLHKARPAALAEDHLGRIWVATSRNELGYIEEGRYVAVTVPPGPIEAMATDLKGNLWIANRKEGLLRRAPDGGIEQTPWADLGGAGPVSAMVVDSEGTVWIGLWSGRVMSVSGGQARASLLPRDTGINGRVNQMRIEPDGTLWVASPLGLHGIKNGRAIRIDKSSGVPCDAVHWTQADETSVWMHTDCGLVQIARAALDAWARPAEPAANSRIKVQMLKHWDGIRARPTTNAVWQLAEVRLFTPKAGLARDGRIWIASGDGVAVVDPARPTHNRMVPPVHVEQVISDGTTHDPRALLQLPPLQRNLEIQYVGLSLTDPDKVKFRYKLEGRDAAWQDAGNRRRAFYTDLPPGAYRFHVVAANNSGVWNERGDTIDFSIAPAWWQTAWFRACCAAALAVLLYGLYRLRLSQVARQFNMTLDARVNERVRIARDLHDTLLQRFHAVLLRLQTALELLPESEGRRIVAKTLDEAADAVTEGRDAVHALRASSDEDDDLATSILAMGGTLVAELGDAVKLHVEVRGTVRSLHPLMRDEIFRVASEALRNAFRHAQARHVEVEFTYGEGQLRLRVRDDGKGMDHDILERGGRAGHFGLRGMRERAELIGGKITLWSAENSGTEVELTVPAQRAYVEKPRGVEVPTPPKFPAHHEQ